MPLLPFGGISGVIKVTHSYLGGRMDIVKLARKLFEKDQQHWAEIYQKARDDLYFTSDAEDAQWDSKDLTDRKRTGRPALTVDQLSQFIHQVVNDIRMNTPSITVIPSDMEASQESAEIIKGLIRNIEYVSGADDVYDTASLNSVRGSIGFIRVEHGYVRDDSFEQELLIKRVINPLAVYLDSDSIEADGRDAKHAFVLDSISTDQFDDLYPGFDAVDFQSKDQRPTDKDTITIVEFFRIEETKVMIGMNDDGTSEEMIDGKAYKMTRKTKKKVVRRYKLSGSDILEETTFPGEYIPLIPVYGEEAWVDGKRNIYSLIRRSKDAQRLYNFMKSNDIEVLSQQPKAPWMAAEGQIVNKEPWLNPDDSQVLEYTTTDLAGNPVPPPQRIQPPTISTGFFQAGQQAVDDIKATLGMYNASIGRKGNATSGKQELVQQQEGDVATFHFGDNLSRSIAHCGRVLVCAIPEIYDTPRALRIIGEEEEPKQVGINGMAVEGQKEQYDLTKGKYDVRVITGAPYTTKRQEAAQFFTEIVTRQPDLMTVMGDLLFKYSDIAGAEAMASRMKKVIDPKFLEDEDRMRMEQEQQMQQVVDPEKEQMKQLIQQGAQELQAMQQEIEALNEQLASKKMDIAVKVNENQSKNQLESSKLMLEKQRLDTDQYKIDKEAEIKIAELQLKALEMQLLAMQPEDGAETPEMPDNGMEQEQKYQEQQMKAMQTAAILESINSVKASLDALTNGINRPKQVVYGQDGSILGVQ